jgi:hypothetical protein
MLCTGLLFLQVSPLWTQGPKRLVSADYRDYHTWFHERSQVADLYRGHTTLYTFSEGARVLRQPRRDAPPVITLPIGYPVRNIALETNQFIFEEINGYRELWFLVSGEDPQGVRFQGYLWGGDIAKGWRWEDITGDGAKELVMLGLSGQPRTRLKDINAEIRILKSQRLLTRTTAPGLCLFDGCDTSPLLRVLRDPAYPGMLIVEASTMSIGCEVGIEKAFFSWNGRQLERVFHAEYTSKREYFSQDFFVSDGPNGRKQCRYCGEDKQFNPVWRCEPAAKARTTPETSPVAAQPERPPRA